jgi:hypothetical protein
VAVTPANQPEHQAVDPLMDEAQKHGDAEAALVDRGFLASERLTKMRSEGKRIICKPWPSRNQGRFTKDDFVIDLKARSLKCPAGKTAQIAEKSLLARFEARTCRACQLRASCTSAQGDRGRTVSIHPQEDLLIELRARRKTKEGRCELRERVHVEHALAKVIAVQGPRARYKGARRNELDVRRCAAVVNLQAIARARAA